MAAGGACGVPAAAGGARLASLTVGTSVMAAADRQ